jgi:hypothetical protein
VPAEEWRRRVKESPPFSQSPLHLFGLCRRAHSDRWWLSRSAVFPLLCQTGVSTMFSGDLTCYRQMRNGRATGIYVSLHGLEPNQCTGISLLDQHGIERSDQPVVNRVSGLGGSRFLDGFKPPSAETSLQAGFSSTAGSRRWTIRRCRCCCAHAAGEEVAE